MTHDHASSRSPASDFLRSHIRTVPDWPAPGVQFRDITPLLQDPAVFRVLIDAFVQRYQGPNADPALRPDVVAGLDARGFIVGAVVAHQLNVGFIPIRKKGKLPGTVISEAYQLEYGEAVMEIHDDALRPGERVLIVDDLLATGGTAAAGIKLCERLGAEVIGCAFVIDLPELGGRKLLEGLGYEVHALTEFDGA